MQPSIDRREAETTHRIGQLAPLVVRKTYAPGPAPGVVLCPVARHAAARHAAAMDQITPSSVTRWQFSATEIAQYRRDGYVVARGVMGPRSVAACNAALSDLASGRLPARDTVLMYESSHDAAT